MALPTTHTNTNKDLTVIGDIHNRLEALRTAVDYAKGHIVFLGDVGHKGPGEDCPKVISFIQDLVSEGTATCVRGNHDFTMGKGKFGNPEHEGNTTDEQRAWLKKRPLFVRYNGWLFMHGGMTGSCFGVIQHLIDEGHLPKEGDWTAEIVDAAEASLSSKFRKKLQNCMYTRYVKGPKRQLVSWGNETPEDEYWADSYKGEYGFVIFGHNPWEDVAYFDHAMGIDLGAGSFPVDLDTPKHGLGFALRDTRICALTVKGDTATYVRTYFASGEYSGFIQCSGPIEVRNYGPHPHAAGKGYAYCAAFDEYRASRDALERAYLANEINRLGGNVKYSVLSKWQIKELKGDITQAVLSVQHASGSDESPSPKLKMSLLLGAEAALRVGLQYGLDDLVESTLFNAWMPIVDYIRESDGFDGLPKMISKYLDKNPTTNRKLQRFWEALMLDPIATDTPSNEEINDLLLPPEYYR
jgi:hypothetical protein